mgnify:CR=1 FL=1|tara:strand:+ start:693 stop:902 length:210 start_codon:yes stop_codon:yes gene_type:complete
MDEMKQLLSELLEAKEELQLELDTIIEMKKLIELREMQCHSFQTACSITKMHTEITLMKGYIYELKEKI